jgi:hypothetical protein
MENQAGRRNSTEWSNNKPAPDLWACFHPVLFRMTLNYLEPALWKCERIERLPVNMPFGYKYSSNIKLPASYHLHHHAQSMGFFATLFLVLHILQNLTIDSYFYKSNLIHQVENIRNSSYFYILSILPLFYVKCS